MQLSRFITPGAKACRMRHFGTRTTRTFVFRPLTTMFRNQRAWLATQQPVKHDDHHREPGVEFHGGKRFIRLPLVTMDDIPVPQYPFKEMYDKEQWYFNRILAFGIAFFSFTCFVIIHKTRPADLLVYNMLLSRFIVSPGSKACQMRLFNSKMPGAFVFCPVTTVFNNQRMLLATTHQPAKHDDHHHEPGVEFHGGKRFIKLPLVTMDDIPVPQYPFKEIYDKEQWYFNRMLAFGLAFFGFTCLVMYFDSTLKFDRALMPYSYRNRHKEIAKYKKDDSPPKKKIYFDLEGNHANKPSGDIMKP